MSDLLEIPDLRKHLAPISIERFHRMIDMGAFDDWNVELLNGNLVEKMTKSALHEFVVESLNARLREFLQSGSLFVRKEGPITIGNSEPEPDISVVEGSLADFKHSNPTTARFVIEVAISSGKIDFAKAAIYAAAGIPEYWIVLPEKRETAVFRNPVAGEYTDKTVVSVDQTVSSSAFPGFTLELSDLLDA